MTAQLNRVRGVDTADDAIIIEWSFAIDPNSRNWQVIPTSQALMKLYKRMVPAFNAVNGGTASPDDEIMLEIYEKTAELRERARVSHSTPVTKRHDLIGKEVLKEFNAGYFKGTVMRLDAPGFLVEYEDGDSEHLSEEEIKGILYTPSDRTLMDRIEYIEASGNKAQSFSKMVKEIVKGRPRMAEQLAFIFKELGGADITTRGRFYVNDIGPWLWSEMGSYEVEKLHWAKRVLESLTQIQ